MAPSFDRQGAVAAIEEIITDLKRGHKIPQDQRSNLERLASQSWSSLPVYIQQKIKLFFDVNTTTNPVSVRFRTLG